MTKSDPFSIGALATIADKLSRPNQRFPDTVNVPEATFKRWQNEPAKIDKPDHFKYEHYLGSVYVNSVAMSCPVCALELDKDKFLNDLRKQGIPERYLTLTWDDLEMVGPFPRLRRGAERIELMLERNASLVLHGPSGFGKTQSSMLIARAAIDKGFSVKVVNIADLAIDVRQSYEGDGEGLNERSAINQLIEPDLLILEDLGAGETGAAAVERRLLYHATEKRQNNRRPLIITTNLLPSELNDLVGARIMGRMQPLSMIDFSGSKNFRESKGQLW